jgi:hypothetical protein
MSGESTYLSLRNIYPNLTGILTPYEGTIPEESDQQGLGVSVETGKVFGKVDVLKTVAVLAVLIFLLFAFGIVE